MYCENILLNIFLMYLFLGTIIVTSIFEVYHTIIDTCNSQYKNVKLNSWFDNYVPIEFWCNLQLHTLSIYL